MFEIPLPIYGTYHILNSDKSSTMCKKTIMIPINEKEESMIDNIGKSILSFERDGITFNVTMRDIYCYGEIDLTDEDTCYDIQNFNFLDYLGAVGIHIYSRYNYETHTCKSPTRHLLWTETWNPLTLFKMAHGYLGKPKRILLFNQTTK